MNRKHIVVFALLPLVAACSVAPKFEQPAVETPEDFKQAAEALPESERGQWKAGEPAEAQPRGEWWRAFRDPVLDELMTAALADSPTLQVAAARVDQSRAVLGITSADRMPTVTAGVGPFNTRPSPGSQGLPPGADTSATTLWRANAVASYELDLFGRVKNNVLAAKQDLEGAEATYRSVVLALQADVARTYFDLREADLDVQLLRDALQLRERNMQLVVARFENGATSELDVARARAEQSAVRADLEATRGRRVQLEAALAVLVGRAPASFALEAASDLPLPPTIPAGLPSTLLERRPDIVAAQRTLVASNARIGVAKSAFFPSVRLTGQGGFESEDIGDLFRWSSRTWFLGPFLGTLLSVPIIDGGRNKSELARTRAVYEQSVGEYRNRVLSAFGDVEGSLAGLRSLSAQAGAIDDALQASRRAQQIAQLRYEAGATGYLDVLDAQRTLVDVERNANRIRGAQVTGTVALIRALGGGWGDVPAVAGAPAAEMTAAK